jgi:parvulin-like peptidyl-prolyl isomerase
MMQTGSKDQVDALLALLSRYQMLPQLVRNLIIDQAIADISCTDEERQAAIEAFEAQQQITSDNRDIWLDRQGMTLAQMHDLALRPVLLEKYKTTVWQPKVDNYFLTRKTHLDQVVYSLIRTKDMGLAQEIYFRILEGEQSFAELAREYSQGAEAKTSGLLGPVPLTQPHPAISKLLSVSQPGQLWAPRPLAEWVVIIRLEKLIPAQLDKSMRRRLQDELFENWLTQKIQQVDIIQFVTTSLRDRH